MVDGQRARPHETMSLGHFATRNPEHFARQYFRAMQHHQAMHRAHELMRVIAPAHELGDRQCFDCRSDYLGNDLCKLRTGLYVRIKQRFGFAVHAPLEAGDTID